MNRSFQRTDRINRQIARILAEVLLKHTEDKRLRQANITRVDVSPDLRSAKIFYTTLNPELSIGKALEGASGFLRSELAHRLKMRSTPELKFYYDDTLDQIRKIESLLNPPKDD